MWPAVYGPCLGPFVFVCDRTRQLLSCFLLLYISRRRGDRDPSPRALASYRWESCRGMMGISVESSVIRTITDLHNFAPHQAHLCLRNSPINPLLRFHLPAHHRQMTSLLKSKTVGLSVRLSNRISSCELWLLHPQMQLPFLCLRYRGLFEKERRTENKMRGDFEPHG